MKPFVIAALLGFALAQDQAGAPPAPDAISPEACAQNCQKEFDACRGKADPNMAVCAEARASCLGFVPGDAQPTACSGKYDGPTHAATSSSGPSPTGQQDACAKKCTDEFNACRGKPDPNMSVCASEYTMCLGWDHLPRDELPLSCSKAHTSGHAGPTNHPNPTKTHGTIVTAGAAAFEPAYALYALGGALALL